ncbi:MAG: NAD(P)H-binding protein [Pseudomonadota bacterium]
MPVTEAASVKPPNATVRGPVLVVGGTGHYGREIVRCLCQHGHPVRVLSRNAAGARAIVGHQPEIVEGDITSREAVARSVAGAERIVISISAGNPKLIRQARRIERDSVLMLLEEARQAGVGRVVYLTGYEIRRDLIFRCGFEHATIYLDVEEAIARSTFNWTILGEAPSTEIFFAIIRGNRMSFPGGGPPAFPSVSRLDVGEIAAQAVVRDDLANQRFRVTGPEALSFPEAASRISKMTGRQIVFRAIPLAPIRAAAFLSRPFYPFLHYLVGAARMLNSFPQDLVAQVPADHSRLVRTFDYSPTTLEMDALRRVTPKRQQ